MQFSRYDLRYSYSAGHKGISKVFFPQQTIPVPIRHPQVMSRLDQR